MALGKTNLSPEEQVRALITYDDTLAAGSSLESGASSLNDFGSSVISQLNRIINSTVTGNDWFADINTTASGKQRGVNDLNTDLADLEERKLLCRSQVLADVTVGASENWVVLGVGELPSEVVAIATTQNGTVGASSALSGAGFEVHELIEIAGANAVTPKNLVLVRDASTLQPLQSGGRDIYGLMQFESGLVDGDTITATSPDRAKVSFVRINSAGDDLEAVPVADIENEVINYSYAFRTDLESVPEDCFLSNGTFTDLTASVDVTRQEAYTNQGATPVDLTTNATLDLEGAGLVWKIRDDLEADLFAITEGSGGGTSDVTIASGVASYNNNAGDVNFDNGITVDNGSNAINLGVSADQIDFTGNGTLTATSASTVTVTADSANATLSTTTSGNVVVSSAGDVDVDGTNVLVDATSGVSIDAAAASNFTVAGADLALATTTSGNVDIDAAVDILMDSDCAVFGVSNQDTGHWHDRADHHLFGDTNRGDNYLGLNAAYASGTSTTGGMTVIRTSATVTNGTITASTAGVPATSDPSFTTSGITGLSAGTLILVEGASPECLNGLYEVEDGSTTTLTLRGPNGLNGFGSGNTFTKGDVDTNGSASGTIYTATVCAIRCSTTGSWEVGDGSTTPYTFTELGTTAGSTLQAAYVASAPNTPSVDVTSTNGSLEFSNDTAADTTTVLEVNREPGSSTAGLGLDVNFNANTTGNAVDVTDAGSGNAVNVASTGSGDGILVNNTGSGRAMVVQDGGGNVLVVDSVGTFQVTPTSGSDAIINVTGAGSVDVDADSGGMTFDAVGGPISVTTTTSGDITVTSAAAVNTTVNANSTVDISTDGVTYDVTDGTNDLFTVSRNDAGGDTVAVTSSVADFTSDAAAFSLDATLASNVTVDSATLTVSTTTSGNVAVTAASDVDVDGTNVTVDATSGISLDAAAASNFTTSAGDITIQNTSSTATDGIIITTAAGDAEVQSTDWVVTFPTKRVHSTTNLDADGATAPGIMLNEATYTSFENGNEGNLTVNFNTGYTSATGTNTYQVTVVSCSAVTVDTITAFTNNGAATNPTATTTGTATFSAGDLVLVTGGNDRRNDAIFEVVSHVGNTLTLAASPTAGAEFVHQQAAPTTADNASVCLVTVSVQRVNTSGQYQVTEAVSNTASISYSDFGVDVATLENAWSTNTGTATTLNTNFTGRVTDGDTYLIETETGNHALLSLAAVAGADAITLGTNDSANVTNVRAGTGGVDVTSGGAFDVTAAATSTITTSSGDLTVSNSSTSSAEGVTVQSTANGFVTVQAGTEGDLTLTTTTLVGPGTPGDVTLSTANGASVGTLNITGGNNTGPGGAGSTINITAGSISGGTDQGDVSRVNITGGEDSGGGTGGGRVVVTGGAATAGTADGGSVAIDAGSSTGGNPGDINIGSNNAFDVNITATGDATGTVTKVYKHAVATIAPAGASAPGAVTNETTYFSVENANEGNLAINFGTGYTSSTGTNTYQVSVVSCSAVTTDTITAFTNNGAATNPTATTTGSATFSAGDLILVTGTNNDSRNNGIFEVVSHTGTTLTLAASPTAGAEFVRRQVATTTGDSAPVCLVTLSVQRVNASGQYQITEAVTNTGSISYVDIGTDAATLKNAVNNQLTAGAFTQNSGDLQWGIPDGGTVQIGDSANNVRLQVSGDGASGGGITVTGGNTSDGAGGLVDIDGGAATTATEAGGAVTVTGGTGNTSGAGGAVTIDGGAGGDTGPGSAVTVTGGDGGSTSGAAAGVTLQGGTPVDGNGGGVTLIGSDGVGTNRNGGSVLVGWGLATGTGNDGTIDLLTPTDVSVGQDRDVFRIRNRGGGTGGGEIMEVYTGTAAPTHTATSGSLFLYDDASDGRVYINESSGGSGTDWSRVTTASQAVTRIFFQTDVTTQVNPGGTITSADVTGTLPTRPSANFTWELDAQVFLNGVLLMNSTTTTANEVDDSTANATDIDVETGGPTFRVGDIITVVYYTNSTS